MKNINDLNHIITINYKGRKFEIIRHYDYYYAIDEKDIDNDGNLKCEINCIKMISRPTIYDTIGAIKNKIDY